MQSRSSPIDAQPTPARREPLWPLLRRSYAAFCAAFLAGALLSIPFIYYSVMYRSRCYTEMNYDVGNSPSNEGSFTAWAKSQSGVETFRCERNGTNLWVRWEYRGYNPPEALRRAPEHLRGLGYEFRGMSGGSAGAIGGGVSDEVRDVLTDGRTLAALLFCSQASFGIFALLGIKAVRKKPEMYASPPRQNRFRVIGLGVAAGLLLFTFGSAYSALLARWFDGSPPGPWNALASMAPATRALFMFFAVLIAPVAEELFFRAYLFGMFRRAGYASIGVLVSSALFAAAHISDASNVPVIFVFGVVLALVYYRSGSLFTNIIAHSVTNSLSCLELLRH